MPISNYTAITFAPVQGFIEKSRKLRDLYGSSYILSHLAERVGKAADLRKGCRVISPALIDVAKGTPNQIIIKGDFPEQEARKAFKLAWGEIVDECQSWIHKHINIHESIEVTYCWCKEWDQWKNHAWEFFWVQGSSADEVRKEMNELKRLRAWVGINWKGESSTLSGADAIAYPYMGLFNPKKSSYHQEKEAIERFYRHLSQHTGEIIEPSEQLSIPELIKRLVTITEVAKAIGIPVIEQVYLNYNDLNRLEKNEKTGWFVGDGDAFGKYLKFLAKDTTETEDHADQSSYKFSKAMRDWAAKDFYNWAEENGEGRVIYAGGDDFLGIFYRIPKKKITKENKLEQEKFALTAPECLERLYKFPEVWGSHGHKVTVSVGFVWAFPGVPQRDVLQHCRESEKTAKSQGRDRLAIRILFNSGNHLEWSCPWAYLQPIFEGYCDRNGKKGNDANWIHLYNDVAVLESRHAFHKESTDITLALWDIYFPNITIVIPTTLDRDHPEITKPLSLTDDAILWNKDSDDGLRLSSGILGKEPEIPDEKNPPSKKLNNWFINLAKVGFHLCVDTNSNT